MYYESDLVKAAELGAKLALAQQPVPSCVNMSQAAEMMNSSQYKLRELIKKGDLKINKSGKINTVDIYKILGR